ncbi:GDSL esterase/lipase APG-like isoform X2 [Populus alba x Populus x berolinensis]|nr:GDSL esterase/lipase APG-like isoform X2 [Populus alba x Populus x berolinensis]
MDSFYRKAIVLASALALAVVSGGYGQDTLFPAIISFGDSSVDVGNNNYLSTIFKANYPPYGRDFANHKPTGRFCNGKLTIDFTAKALGFKTYAPAYLSPEASGKNLLIGVNFASAASGYDDKTAFLNLKHFKEYQTKLMKVAGGRKSASIIKDALYILSTGTADLFQNYYVNPSVNKVYTPDLYSSYLATTFSSFVKDLYGLGARKLGVTSLPPLGCVPEARNFFGYRGNDCVSWVNTFARKFNKNLNLAADNLRKQLPGLKIVVFDIYKPLEDLVKSPLTYGFVEARRGCCQTRTAGKISVLCNPRLPGTCPNATQFVFWDSVHPSQAANQVIADAILIQGVSLLG